jgi:hypothetical protein
MADSEKEFLQLSMVFPHPKEGEDQIWIMILRNPALTGLLKTPQLDVHVAATFSCCPNPFLQHLIFMINEHLTSSFIPVLYALMTSKYKEAY